MFTKRYTMIFNFFLIVALTLGGLQLNTIPVLAAPLANGSGDVDVANLLNPDGTLNTSGVSGSLALGGWDIQLDPQRGPVFSPSGSGTTNAWKKVGAGTESTEEVYAIAVSGSNAYVGGDFLSLTGCANCKHIAKWNGSTWSALGTGVGLDPTDTGENVQVIRISGTDVYVGGAFISVPGCSVPTDCKYIAKWNGNTWSNLGQGPSNRYVTAIMTSGSDVYVGGRFDSVTGCSTPTNCKGIAKWNASSGWSALGQGVEDNKEVFVIAISSSGVVIGGNFTFTKPLNSCDDCTYIARWDGSVWSPLGTGIDVVNFGNVRAIAISGADVYAGGEFASVADCTTSTNCKGIAKWNASSGWSALGTGISNLTGVRAIATSGTDVYVGGPFTSVADCTTPANCKGIAKWNAGTGWSEMAGGTNARVNGIVISGPDIWAVGAFSSAGSVATNYIAAYAADPEVATSVPAEGQNLTGGTSTLAVHFNKTVLHDASANSATSLSNYMLVSPGPNQVFNTSDTSSAICASVHVPEGDDVNVAISGITYDSDTDTASLTIAPAAMPLPAGLYRLYVCGAASIHDMFGIAINGGANFAVNFSATAADSTAGSSAGSTSTAGDPKKLPETGFAPNRVTSLPAQPASLAYAKMSGLWVEIPSQKIQANIVGVPEVNSNWDVSWLGSDAGWLNGTAFPTWNGNSVITAHVTDANGRPGPFANLKNLAYGNKIVVHLYGEKYTYEVRQSRTVFPGATLYAFEHLQDHAYLTLITCQGYNFLTDSYMFRRVVRAVLVSVTAE